MDAGNPFYSETFICDIQPWLNEVPAERLRNAAIQAHLIKDRITIDTLKRTQANSDHNEELVKSIVAGGRDAYQKLCNVVKTLGYDGRHEQMVQLLRRPGPQLDAATSTQTCPRPMASDEQKLPASVRTARDLLAKAVEKAGIQISGGLASDAKIPLKDIFVNLTLLTKEELSELFSNESSSFSSGSERARQLKLFSEAQPQRVATAERGIELEDIFSATSERSCNQGTAPRPGCDHEVADSGLLEPRAKKPVEENKKNVLAFGSAGCGKSTIFLIMLEYLWSKGELWRGKFDLVLAVELRRAEVQSATSLCDLLARRFSSLDVETNELEEMSRFFRSNLSRLCIVLDGLDECKLENCSEYMRDLLLRRRSGDMHVVVTSRPCTDAHTLSQCGEYQQQVEVVGFSPDNVETYVKNVVGGVKGEGMLKQLRSQEGTMSLMCTPLFAALACELFMDDRDGSKLPESSTGLYESLVRRVMERRAGKRYKTLSAIKTDEVEVLKELSGFALSMLAQQKMVFNEEDVISAQLSALAIELGLLMAYKSTSSTEDRQYRFAHLSFQEFLAAWYVSSEMLNDENDAAWLVRRVGHYSGHMTMFWRFLIALTPPNPAVAIMEHLWRIICDDDRTQRACSQTDTRLLDDIVSRSQPTKQSNDVDRIHAVLKSALSVEKMKDLADQLLVGTAGQGRGRQRVDNALPRGRELTDDLYLDTLVSVWKNEAAEASAEVFLSAVRKVDPATASHCEQHAMTSAKSEISTPSSPGAAPAATTASIRPPALVEGERRCLADLLVAYLEHCQYQGTYSCNGHCSFFSQVFSLNYSLVQLSLLDCTAIAHFLTTHSCVDVQEVCLYGCGLPSTAMRCILNGLAHYTHVRVLYLIRNDCTDGNVFSSAILSASSSLEDVDLDENKVGIDGFALICRALSSCRKLRNVSLSRLCTGEYGADVPLTSILEILHSNRNLEVLDVLGYTFTYGPRSEERRVLAQFVSAVHQCSKLRILYFSPEYGDNSRLVSELQPLVDDPECALEPHGQI
ncbi:NACHT, LRR and PYD domains-containing protein 3-like [Sycon ciliatum]|uniref:NACHT, LRR and PYD domains-containing protein 3-like n=1 Tax=Sycon ciliatum TaxID=27933 RepID=UPI0031F6A36C